MLARLRAHLTYANVASSVALFVALSGGVAFAVTQLDANSVKSKHIVNEQVKSTDLRNDAVTGDDVDEDSLLGLVRGEGQLLFAETTQTANTDEDLIALPGGLGVIETTSCNPNATPASRSASVGLDNDTDHDLIVWSDGGFSGPNNNTVVPPSSGKGLGSLVVGNGESNELVHGHVLRPDTGKAADIAVAKITNATECRFSVMAQTNAGIP